MTEKMRTAMLKLATVRGWEVFPLRPKTKIAYKRAETSNGRAWGATADPGEVERDFTRWARANGGLPTGPRNGIFVLDVDTLAAHGRDGHAALRALEAQHSRLPATLESLTPTGGRHLVFKYPTDRDVRNAANVGGHQGLDVRGIGGMVVCPPSVRGGAEYRWVDEDAEVAEAPQWLLDIVTVERRATADLAADSFSNPQNRPPVDDAELAAAVKAIPNPGDQGWEAWNRVALALWRATEGSELGLELFDEWSKKAAGTYDAANTVERWNTIATSPPNHIGVGTILFMADESSPGWRSAHVAREAVRDLEPEDFAQTERSSSGGDTRNPRSSSDEDTREGGDTRDSRLVQKTEPKLSDFWANMENHQYIYVPTGSMWPPASINNLFGKVALLDDHGEPQRDEEGDLRLVPAGQWLDIHRPVHQVLWSPGEGRTVRGRHLLEGGWVQKGGAQCYNMYRPPRKEQGGDPVQAQRWISHLVKLYGEEAAMHITMWMAHKVQKPGVKVNHALVLLGRQGIGKDTALEPLKHAVGPWNFIDVSPHDILSPYSGYLQSVVLRINEARDLGDVNRYQFYERTKVMIAAPPDVLRVNEKYIRERAVQNCCGVIFTTNDKGGLYLPEDDRRHYVAYSELTKDDFPSGYWTDLWEYYDHGGFLHVAAYLRTVDVSAFDPKAPPPKTEAFYEIVAMSRASEAPELESALNGIGNPPALTVSMLADHCATGPLSSFYEWLTDRKNLKSRGRILAEAGYVAVRNPDNAKGLWKIAARSEHAVIYAQASLTMAERLRVSSELARGSSTGPSEPPVGPATVTPIGGRPRRRS